MPEILREHGHEGSVDVVKRRHRGLRPSKERPVQRPAPVLEVDWAELSAGPRSPGAERRIYALLGCSA